MKHARIQAIVTVCCLLLVLMAGAVGAQSMDNMDEMDSMGMMDDKMDKPLMQTCKSLVSVIVVKSDTPGIQCRRVSKGAIGNDNVLMQGPIDAVDIWGPSNAFGEVCFEGAGSVTFLDAMISPRWETAIDYSMKDGMTCAAISGPGTYVLLPGMMTDDMMTMDDMDHGRRDDHG